MNRGQHSASPQAGIEDQVLNAPLQWNEPQQDGILLGHSTASYHYPVGYPSFPQGGMYNQTGHYGKTMVFCLREVLNDEHLPSSAP